MTITLHWWLMPIVLVVSGWIIGSRAGTWDFFTPMVALALWMGAIGICIGHWVA
jgi:hypothetical protein